MCAKTELNCYVLLFVLRKMAPSFSWNKLKLLTVPVLAVTGASGTTTTSDGESVYCISTYSSPFYLSKTMYISCCAHAFVTIIFLGLHQPRGDGSARGGGGVLFHA